MYWTFIDDFVLGACIATVYRSHDGLWLTLAQITALRWGLATQELALA